jgi:hypothetical protein
MAKANLILPDGTKVTIDGTAEEVANLLSKFSQPQEGGGQKKVTGRKKKTAGRTGKGTAPSRKGPQTLIAEFVEEGYFKSKRTIADIQKKLEQGGHIYAQTSLSPPLLRLTRKKVLRRIKDKKGWVYVS